MAVHACLKNEFTEDEKYNNIMSWLNISFANRMQIIYSPYLEQWYMLCQRSVHTVFIITNKFSLLLFLLSGLSIWLTPISLTLWNSIHLIWWDPKWLDKSIVQNSPVNMSNFTKDEELLTELNDERVELMIPVIVYVSVLMLVGTFGNILVLVYYGCKSKTSTNSFFIVALAVFDLSMCAVSMPIEIVDLRFYYMFTNVPACKISRLLNHLAADGSATTLLGIAADRYRRLCCPLKPQLEIKHARIAVFLVGLLAAILSWPALIFYEPVTVNVTNPENNSTILQGSDCTTTKDDKYRTYLWAFNIVQLVIYIVATTTLIVLYCLVGRAIYRYKRRRLKYASSKRIAYDSKYNRKEKQSKTDSTEKCDSESDIGNGSTIETDAAETSIQTVESTLENGTEHFPNIGNNEKENTACSKGAKLKRKQFVATRNIKNNSRYRSPKDKTPDIKTIKCTVLMFVISIFYIVGYLPYLVLVIWRIFQSGYEGDILSDSALVGFNIGIRSYLIPSCVNPLLYGGFNDNFRNFFFTTFCPCMGKKRKKLRSSTSITSH